MNVVAQLVSYALSAYTPPSKRLSYLLLCTYSLLYFYYRTYNFTLNSAPFAHTISERKFPSEVEEAPLVYLSSALVPLPSLRPLVHALLVPISTTSTSQQALDLPTGYLQHALLPVYAGPDE